MTMTHPGLALWAIDLIYFCLIGLSAWMLWKPFAIPTSTHKKWFIGSFIQNPWLLFFSRLVFVILFITIIIAGLVGTPIAELNMATVFTWNLWWAGLIFSIFFLGSAWCAICPWNSIAQWLVRRKLWKRSQLDNSLNLSVPKWARNVWPALIFFVALTWLELGLGITVDPYATALISLLMVLLATASLSIFKRHAFCQYFCPVGRTVGFYAQLSATALRPINADICAECTTLECYHGSDSIEPCPTNQVMGTLTQNTYCTSCGNCTQSCPQKNVSWALRSPSIEAISSARPHWDEAWFMICLLSLTAFHGLTMMTFWQEGMNQLALILNDSGQLLFSFSIALLGVLVAYALIYSLFTQLSAKLSKQSFSSVFTTFAFINLPLAFAYHMAHNLNHLIREGGNLGKIMANPLGLEQQPLSLLEKHEQHMNMWFSQQTLSVIQALLMIFGFWVAIQVIRHRSHALNLKQRIELMPMLFYALLITEFHLWMLAQPMTMRM